MRRYDDGLDFWRGLLTALPFCVAFWLGLFWLILKVLR